MITIGEAASWFEGEGSIGYYSKQLRMYASSTDLEVLEQFNKVIGGGGAVFAKKQINNNAWKPIWCWQAWNTYYVINLMKQFWPHLFSRRRTQIIAAIELYLTDSYCSHTRNHMITVRSMQQWIKTQQ